MLQAAGRQVGRGLIHQGSSPSNMILQQTRQRSIRSGAARWTNSIWATASRNTNTAAIPVSLFLQNPVIPTIREISTTATKLSSVKVVISPTVSLGSYDEDDDG